MRFRTKVVFSILGLVGGACPSFAESPGTTIRWTWPPYIILPLLATAVLYLIGILKIRRRRTPVPALPIFCFVAGWTSLLLALDSPMHEMSEQLFWVHMTQHEILMLISAPLMVLGRPLVPFLWALPNGARSLAGEIGRSHSFRRVWRRLSAPLTTWLLSAAALWLWHAPSLFSATLENDAVHAAQHISFLATALLFWWALLSQHGGRLGYGGAVAYVFTTAIHTSVLGALLTFAPTVWYRPYLASAPAWHISALEDQQIGGLIMWIPAGSLLTMIGLVLFVKWLNESQRRWEYTRTAALIRASHGGTT